MANMGKKCTIVCYKDTRVGRTNGDCIPWINGHCTTFIQSSYQLDNAMHGIQEGSGDSDDSEVQGDGQSAGGAAAKSGGQGSAHTFVQQPTTSFSRKRKAGGLAKLI
ncbi:hypothetical protein U1Q18_021866 [Sarracenia purpurea var. burkii]